ncbi:hypothetical protein FHR84_000046 [Actinopolyspora biskrensis]|uniref:Uncharacterized protein n=1 Tax=Actinopolyspora biskrensis TaxID=1470178 RepID=A0A852YSP7_9ACTN|nr:hypothetical protein [Actinopolyspora biskrensis]NYH76732.1 hypothetical protein [Actinopolyspora biskrensis]
MRDEHEGADYERLVGEMRCLLRDVAARVEEFLLELGGPERTASGEETDARGETAESGSGEGARDSRCCPLCGVLSLLRQHDGRGVRSAELPEQLTGLLAALRDVARARAPGGSGSGAGASPGDERADAAAASDPETEEDAGPTAERVRPIPVRRVAGSVLDDQT